MMKRLLRVAMYRLAIVKKNRYEAKRIGMMSEVSRRVQVREFNGMLCLSIDGIPVLPMREFNRQTVSDARLLLFNYLKETRHV